MFGRATIRLGIGPYSSLVFFVLTCISFSQVQLRGIRCNGKIWCNGAKQEKKCFESPEGMHSFRISGTTKSGAISSGKTDTKLVQVCVCACVRVCAGLLVQEKKASKKASC